MPNFTIFETKTAQIAITNQTPAAVRISIQAELKGLTVSVPATSQEVAIPAGLSATFPLSFTMPGTPGAYELQIDVLGRFSWETVSSVIAEYMGSEIVQVLAPTWDIDFSVQWAPSPDPIAPQGRRLGDVDGDGEITSADAHIIAQIISGAFSPTQDQLWAADVTQDGIVSMADAQRISRYYLGLADIPELYYEVGMPIPRVI